MNGLSVAGMAIGATIALPELVKHRYDKLMISGVIQAGSSLGILIPPSVVLVLYSLIARQPVSQLWLAGIGPGLLMAALFIVYILIRTWLNPALAPPMPAEERAADHLAERFRLLRAGFLPLVIFAAMMIPFVKGWTSLTESSVVGALAAGDRRHHQGPLHPSGVRGRDPPDAGHHLHVHADHHGGAELWRGL
jgi:TRAP-type mannitol/chloroaromatic compound transport system permease large subunit